MNEYIFESLDQTKQFTIRGVFKLDLEIGSVLFFNDKPYKLKGIMEEN